MRLAAVLIAALALPACGGGEEEAGPGAGDPPRACTQIGCAGGVQVDVVDERARARGVLVVRVCVDGECARQELPADPAERRGLHFELEVPDADTAEVTVRVRRAGGRILGRGETSAPVERSRPNGPDCPPECRHVRVRLDPATGGLAAG
jgi:hypothetical protein